MQLNYEYQVTIQPVEYKVWKKISRESCLQLKWAGHVFGYEGLWPLFVFYLVIIIVVQILYLFYYLKNVKVVPDIQGQFLLFKNASPLTWDKSDPTLVAHVFSIPLRLSFRVSTVLENQNLSMHI